jgi:hypothetical protein
MDRLRPVFAGLLLVSAALCFAATACSDIHPEANNEGGGLLESPTHEADTLRQDEERHQ